VNAATQFRLPFEPAASWSRDAFLLSASNREAVLCLDRWIAGGSGALALIGPAGSGKTHLAQAWADAMGATVVIPGRPAPIDPSGPLLIEDIDLGFEADSLFHLLNQAAAGRPILLTGRLRPLAWDSGLPDLRSRLNALPVAEIAAPDDALLQTVLERLFMDRHIRPDADLYPYLLARMERSVAAARRLVAHMDEAAAARSRPINKALARDLFGESADLFDDDLVES
jgi:chromosomal replication initiation ATPase DnaA